MNITERNGKKGVSYNIRVFVGTDVDGKKKFKSMTWRPEEGMNRRQIQKELQKVAIHFEEECLKGKISKKKITFKDLSNEWFKLVSETGELNISTISRMKLCCDRTYKAIGDMFVDEIKYRHIQNFILSLGKDGVNQRTGKGLSPKTQRHYITYISDVINYGIRCELLESNPCDNVKPTRDKTVKEPKKCYTVEEEQRLIEALNAQATLHYRVMMHLFIFYAVRREEVLGLEWKDFDFKQRTMQIVRTSKYDKIAGYYTDNTKTAESTRTLELSDETILLLEKFKADYDDLKKNVGNCWHNTDRLFVQWNGTPIHPNTPYTWLKRFCERNKLVFRGLHNFRHTAISISIANGTDIKTVSAFAGHSKPTTTENVYAHEIKSVTKRAVKSIADVINGKTNL